MFTLPRFQRRRSHVANPTPTIDAIGGPAICGGDFGRMPLTVLLSLMSIVSLVISTGCSDGRPKRVEVTGTVIYEDQPVEGAHVMFTPTGARPASARTDAQGRFALRTFDEHDGAVIGTHQITISKKKFGQNPKDPYAATQNALPEKYRRTDTSGLSVEVTADGQNDFTFELEGKKLQ